MVIEFSQILVEKIQKEIETGISILVLLENDMGTQQDETSASAVCVVKDILHNVKDMIARMAKDDAGDEEV